MYIYFFRVRVNQGLPEQVVCGAILRVHDASLRAASQLTPAEASLAARLDSACRDTAAADRGAWEGSGGWVRALTHAHFVAFGEQVLLI